MKKNGLTTVDDFKNEWADAAKHRDEYYSGKRGTVTKRDIEQAIHQLTDGRRRR
jgi:histone H3/H4